MFDNKFLGFFGFDYVGEFSEFKAYTAEKLVKKQASVKIDLDMANAFNENAKRKVKQKEDEKLWKGLESRMLILRHYIIWLVRFIMLILILVLTAEKDKERTIQKGYRNPTAALFGE